MVTSAHCWAQTDDPVIMTVAGQEITRSEFEYAYNKNNNIKGEHSETDLEEYVELFINYKLKVKAAHDAQLDTLTSFRKEYATYRDMQLMPYLTDEEYVDSMALEVYKNIKAQVGDADLLKMSHILLRVPQQASDALRKQKEERIDSLYNALQHGADFAELAKKFSEDRATASVGGEFPWIGPGQLPPDIEEKANALQVGEYSKPILSIEGYHILWIQDRKKLEPFEDLKKEIVAQLEANGIKPMASEHRLRRMMAESGGKASREDIMLRLQKEAEKDSPDLHYLFNEYYDGLLLYSASDRLVWQKAAEDVAGLKAFYKKNKSNYLWKSPHFKGYICFARHENLLADMERFVKKYKGTNAVEDFNNSFNKDSLKLVRLKYGVYDNGDDAYVDYTYFGGAEPKENKLYPFYRVIGKMVKKPESYEDVKAQVVSDYQDVKEREWVADLRKKYPFSVNKDVLNTVNKH